MNRIESLARKLAKRAEKDVWRGSDETPYFRFCRVIDFDKGISAIYTRDVGHHSSGWWKNPDYERCRHLSLSFFDPDTRGPRPRDDVQTRQLISLLFAHHKRWLWCEPPYSDDGKKLDVWHYRLFCDKGWNPIKPRGEVYNKELTEAGWLSFSDLNAYLKAQQRGGVLIPIPPVENQS